MVNKDGEDKVISDKALELFNLILGKKLVCVAPCGSMFTTKKAGVIAEVTRQLFAKRVEIKEKMIKLKKSIPELRGDNIATTKEKIAQLHSYQLAIKIILNAIFGITSVPYSRYFNKNIAEAIVSCGRTTRAAGEKFVNDLLNGDNEELKKVLEQIKNDLVDGK
jgi:DNA polymerase elongation subunit (family B)